MSRLPLALAALLVLAPQPASAHARLESASPAANATVRSGIAELQLTFNEPVEPALSVVEIDDGQGRLLLSSKGTAVCEDKTCRMTLPALAPGEFTVRYRVLSVDGHVVKGSFSFHVVD